MLRILIFFVASTLTINLLDAQTDTKGTSRLTVEQLSPADANLYNETKEVENFSRNLESLKSAYADNDASRLIAYHAYILSGMRIETDQMTQKVNFEAAQQELRKSASTGQISGAGSASKAPARDPFADATTVSEIRLEKMTNTMAAFERHSFDKGNPEAATRDFAKLDDFLAIMQEELAELKKMKQ